MKRPTLQFLLILSLLLNLGVIGAVGFRVLATGQWPTLFGDTAKQVSLPDALRLTSEQRRQWQALESDFLHDLDNGWQQIRPHREKMLQEIFSAQPDRQRIETERARIADLQQQQQQRVIAQLFKERAMLDAQQQRMLVGILLQETPASAKEEQLHRR